MSQNYQGPQSYGYGPNTNTNPNNFNQPSSNSYQSFGYGVNTAENRFTQNVNPQMRYNNPNQNYELLPNRIQSTNVTYQFQNNQNNTNPYNQPNQYDQVNRNYPTQNIQNAYNQPNTIQNIQTYQSDQTSKPVLTNLFQNGGINQLNAQMQGLKVTPDLQQGLNLWADLAKIIDWDSLLKKKNVAKKQSDTSWITYQQQSWLQPQPSRNIQIQSDRKFSFPNPYIKYKIIPGVDEKMALDVTAKDDLEKGYVKGNLIIWDYHGGPNQQFYIHRCPKEGNQQNVYSQKNRVQDDQFIFINAATGFVISAISLNVGSSRKQNGLCVYPKMKDNANQRWKLRAIKQGSDIFTIQSVDTGSVLDCQSGSRSNGTNVLQWKSNGQKNQMWKVLPA